MKPKTKLEKLVPGNEVEELLREAIQTVEDELKLEDVGWYNLSAGTGDVIDPQARIENLKLSRLYSAKDPLGKQSIRLWTDYTFGTGMVWDTEDEAAKKVLEGFWNAPENKGVLSGRGQRKSSNKLLIDGEVFFAIFLGAKGKATIRFIDPLEITEIITDPDDKESIKFYRRQWSDTQGQSHETIYCSTTNIKNEVATDALGDSVQKSDDALIYHLTNNTETQRGNPLLLPALDWIKQYRRFLASRVAIMLALARFAWKSKVKGGQAAVDAIKAKTDEKTIAAGSQLVENLGVDTIPIKAESGASSAYQDARMIKLQVCAATGLYEQYYGDVSVGSLATAQTVELPMMKMFQSYQALWLGAYQDIDEIVLAHANISPDKWYVDRDFPAIALEDVAAVADAIVKIVGVFPEFVDSPDVQQIAMMTIGVNDPAKALEQITEEAKGNPEVALIRALKPFREVLNKKARVAE